MAKGWVGEPHRDLNILEIFNLLRPKKGLFGKKGSPPRGGIENGGKLPFWDLENGPGEKKGPGEEFFL